ncbi:GNAT family N-acetyltransferase [Halobacillus salinarum]|uniref:GNAT family N-acetyltransferase n=1 Tax=Halobacillus salinarum TaxID=2932257 RepID=A0ABY4EGF2_9BACI|nr:GNAT family N-acetyltransferase [Halobacillus salinarum]UOQ43554.1 GNAT family N-acetyltransferase [Halobacillus salinarum]
MIARTLTKLDAQKCYELRLEALFTNPDAFITTYEQEKSRSNPIQTYEERLESELTRTFGVFEGEILTGVVTLVKETHPKFAHKAMIVGMYVSPQQRMHGAGAKLMETAMHYARTQNIEIIQLSVVSENAAAKALYKRMGFEEYGLEKKAIKLKERYLDEIHMYKFL